MYKAADVIGGIPADHIGGFIRKMCVIAQGDLVFECAGALDSCHE
jgi:hypothetical protein